MSYGRVHQINAENKASASMTENTSVRTTVLRSDIGAGNGGATTARGVAYGFTQ